MGLSWVGSGGDSRRPRLILWLKKAKVPGSCSVLFTIHMHSHNIYHGGAARALGRVRRPRSSSYPVLVDVGWLSFQSRSSSTWKERVCRTREACLSVNLFTCLSVCLPGLESLFMLHCPSTTTPTSRLLVWASEFPLYLSYIVLPGLESDYV